MDWGSIKKFIIDNNSQAHLCICNTDLFEESIQNGVYGFPHSGSKHTKSFWRAVSSMYNIGPHDLIFLYRTNGDAEGCKEIHGPFRIKKISDQSAIYYDPDSTDFPMKIKGKKEKESTADCKARFLFESFEESIHSISNNFELIKKYESKEIWGYRHPAVMNIGAARKKSVTSFTVKQTLTLIDLMQEFGEPRHSLNIAIPVKERVAFYDSLPKDSNHFKLDDDFLLTSDTSDEAFLYSYIIRGFKTPASSIHADLITDFSAVNNSMLKSMNGTSFQKLTFNVMMEVVISPHLQDEMDIVLFDITDTDMLILEVKEGLINQDSIKQTQNYLNLLWSIFPKKNIFANVVGSGKDTNIDLSSDYKNAIRLVKYEKTTQGTLKFLIL